mmetsp:Transcript_13367/g.16205  ORF Transcript_13367/g.16205 Transcript_13367/m.16205 type:complete len:431 (+) Transcript_13367:111-1403(+)
MTECTGSVFSKEEHDWIRIINDCLESDKAVDEYGFVMGVEEDSDNICFVSPEHKLGIHSWCLPKLYAASRSSFYLYKKAYKVSIQDSVLKDSVLTRRLLLRATVPLLMVNPDYYTAWNVRKSLLQKSESQKRDLIEELSFVRLVFTKHPKAGEAWSHRGWLIRELVRIDAIDDQILEGEVEVCQTFIQRYKRLYFGWKHRLLVLTYFTKFSQYEREVQELHKWISQNVSDYSALSYLENVIEKMNKKLDYSTENKEQKLKLVMAEFQIANALILRFPSHLSLWLHQRYLFGLCLSLRDAQVSSKQFLNALRCNDIVLSPEKSSNSPWWSTTSSQTEELTSTSSLLLFQLKVFVQLQKHQYARSQMGYGPISTLVHVYKQILTKEGNACELQNIDRLVESTLVESNTCFRHHTWTSIVDRLATSAPFQSNS